MRVFSFLTVIFAFCSIVYQLFIAQTLSSTLGGTNFRYALTIGLYITSMGFAALFSQRFSKVKPLVNLIDVELLLIVAGLLCAPFILLVEKLRIVLLMSLSLATEPLWISAPIGMLSHLPILLIGVLSGLELPLLMACSKKAKAGEGGGDEGVFQADILAYDYFGTMLGALIFPFVLLPALGIFGVSFLTTGANAVTACVLLMVGRHTNPRFGRQAVLCGIAVLLTAVLFWNRDAVQDVTLRNLYFS